MHLVIKGQLAGIRSLYRVGPKDGLWLLGFKASARNSKASPTTHFFF